MSYSWRPGGIVGGGGGGSSVPSGDYPQVPDLATLASRAHVAREEVVVVDIGDGTSHLYKKILPAAGLSSWVDLGLVGTSSAATPEFVLYPDNDTVLWPDGDTLAWA